MENVSSVHLLTGATGFIGGALALEILDRSPAHLLCLVRASVSQSAQERLLDSLTNAATAYGRSDLEPEIRARCHALRADVGEPDCAIDRLPNVTVQAAWHVAASLSFKLKSRPSTLRHNVEGTANTLKLAKALGASEFNYVSTAFVAGTTTGTILEQPARDPTATNNPYEESKIRAEMLLEEERDCTVRIFRPTIVIGHSKTHAATSLAGLYAAINGAVEYRERKIEALLGDRPLHALGDPQAPMNLIPVDRAVENIWRIRESGSTLRIFHIANATAPTVSELNDTLCEAIGIRPPVLTDNEECLSAVEKIVAEDPRNRFQRPYLSTRRYFDLTHTTAAIGPMASSHPLDAGTLRPYVDWQLQRG
jgi:nucleoside-diphosphate-sugar epimerase